MPYGYNGKILAVDLSSRSWEIRGLDEHTARLYMGGECFIAYTLLNEIPPNTDPLGPDNVLVFSTGIFTGAPLGGSGRHSVGGKSPLTGGFGEAEAGGYWGAELKRSGFDAVIVKGRSTKPVYIYINNGKVEIRSAAHLWGKTTGVVESEIRKENDDDRIRVGQIGIAGEKQSHIACIMFDRNRAAGRTGLGAVMGSKGLKAIAVRGTQKIDYANKERILSVAKWLGSNVQELMGGFTDHGTAAAVMHQNMTNSLPTQNFQFGYFTDAKKIDGTTMTETLLIDRDTCFACPVRCKRVVKAVGEIEIDPIYGGPEFETLGAFGSMCCIDDLVAICKANELCNAYGMDTISAGVTIAFAMECFENGYFTLEDTRGVDLRFGNARSMLTILQQMIQREGFGAFLADGAYQAAQQMDERVMEFVMHVKKQPIPQQEPRAMHGLGLGYALSPTGADHMHNMYDMGYTSKDSGSLKAMEPFGIMEPVPYDSLDHRKVRLYMYVTNLRHLENSIGMCMFMPYSSEQVKDVINGITGWNTSLFELQKVGQRAVTLARLFNLREGLSAQDDRIPERLSHAISSDTAIHPGIGKSSLKKAVHLFYGMIGWDENSGVPKKSVLLELGLEWAIKLQEGIIA